jgi:hypothetical protein
MKNRKFMAITLCIGILASSFGGTLISNAKNDKSEFTIKKNNASLDNSMVSVLPSQKIIELEPEVYNTENVPSDKIITASDKEGEILYKGTLSTLNPEEKDMFNIGEKEIEDMMQKGYSVEDIFEADKISNEIGIEPEALLEKEEATNKSLEQIKKDVLAESRDKTTSELKNKYKNEYKKLKDKKLKEMEIINLLAYADVNNVKVSDTLINEYQKNGDKVFKKAKNEIKVNEVSQETKKEYQLSEVETKDLSEELIGKLEVLSKKTGISVEELAKGYQQGNDNKKK